MWRRDFSGWQWPLLSWASKFFSGRHCRRRIAYHNIIDSSVDPICRKCGAAPRTCSGALAAMKNAPQQQHDFASSVQLTRSSPSCHSHTRWSCTHGKLSRVTRMSHTAAAAAAAVVTVLDVVGFIHSFIHLFIHSFRMTSTNKTLCNAVWAGQQGSKTNT